MLLPFVLGLGRRLACGREAEEAVEGLEDDHDRRGSSQSHDGILNQAVEAQGETRQQDNRVQVGGQKGVLIV